MDNAQEVMKVKDYLRPLIIVDSHRLCYHIMNLQLYNAVDLLVGSFLSHDSSVVYPYPDD